MKTIALFLAAAGLAAGATRESFDDSWRFARFGPMPDGTYLQEPGTDSAGATASTSEAGHPPGHAIDDLFDTRWCASGALADQHLSVDFGRVIPFATVEVDWEKEVPYPHRIEISSDGETWSVLADRMKDSNPSGRSVVKQTATARWVRVVMGKMPAWQWPSIRELRLLDAASERIRPRADKRDHKRPSDPGFDDRGWRTVRLPHDWAIEGPFRMTLPNETGKLPWEGIGWYRKKLRLLPDDETKRISLEFDGAMSNPTIYVNGRQAGAWKYGYSSFAVDITPFLDFTGENQIAVRLENPPQSSRWYPGAGIYRHVRLVRHEPIHFARHGIFVRSTDVSRGSARLRISAEIEGAEKGLSVEHELISPGGQTIAVLAGLDAETVLKSPAIWDTKAPLLHTLRSTLTKDGRVLDREDTTFGIRDIAWEADGFHLNGRRVRLKGVCNHHDLGAIGAAFHTRAAERQLELLKEMGCNAIRTTHNPPAPQLLDLCDRLGFLVIDELFDTWKLPKKPNDYHLHFDEWHERDVAALVRRDRNHPCVIAWSTGNEIPEQGRPDMFRVSEKLTALVRSHDPTRPTTLGVNHLKAALTPFADTVDVVGFNYPVKDKSIVNKVRERKPDGPLLISESSSCVSSRGCYYFPATWEKDKGFRDFQVSSYELYAPRWANRPDLDFELLERHPFLAGEFVWTGFDYFGEPTPYNQDQTNALNFQNEVERAKAMEELRKLGGKAPSRSSYFGILDLCGFPKDRYFLYQSHWRPDHPMAHILPHWNWPERVGEKTPVHVFTSGDQAELFLNGKSLGVKMKKPFEYRLVWEDAIYQPGTLKVKTWKSGRTWAEAERSTTGDAAKLLVDADRPEFSADGHDLCYVTITIADDQDRLVPRSMNRLHFQISGNAEILAVCNGDPTSHEPLQGKSMPAFNGLCQVVLRGIPAKPGPVTLTVRSPDLPDAAIAVTTVE